MINPTGRRNLSLLWLFPAFLALVAVAVNYFRQGEINLVFLILAAVCIAMSFASRSKNRGPDI